MPAKGFDGHNGHNTRQHRHRDFGHHLAERRDQHQQHNARRERGDTASAFPHLHVHDGLPNHRAARNAPVEPGHDIPHAQPDALAALTGGGYGQFVHQLRRQQRFQQAHKRDTQRARPDDAQGVQIERHQQLRKSRQTVAHGAFIPYRWQDLSAGDGE